MGRLRSSPHVRVWLTVVALCGAAAEAQIPWPGPRRQDARALFAEQSDQPGRQADWSGAHWNPATETLWLCRDSGELRAYALQGSDWREAGRFSVGQLDLEAITQADLTGQRVLVLAENDQLILELDVSSGAPEEIRRWDIAELVEEDDGMEGLVFVPDAILEAQGFVDGSGSDYPGSESDLDGLVFLSYQRDGDLYAVDLKPDLTIANLGTYSTPLSKTRGLELDRSTGLLFAVDEDGFVVLQLTSREVDGTSKRALESKLITESPGPDGVEGLALTPATALDAWIVITDDENEDGNRAVLQYEPARPMCWMDSR